MIFVNCSVQFKSHHCFICVCAAPKDGCAVQSMTVRVQLIRLLCLSKGMSCGCEILSTAGFISNYEFPLIIYVKVKLLISNGLGIIFQRIIALSMAGQMFSGEISLTVLCHCLYSLHCSRVSYDSLEFIKTEIAIGFKNEFG